MVIATGTALALGALATAGSAAVASNQQSKATASANAATLQQTAAAQAFLAQGQAKSVSAQKKGIKVAGKNFDKALGAAGLAGQTASAQVLRRETAAQGASDAFAANRGMYNSTVAMNQRRGIQSDTNLALSSIDEATASLLAQIHQNRAMMELRGAQGIGSTYQGFAPAQAQVATANQHVAGNIGAPIAQAGSNIASLLMMYGNQ